MTRTLLNAVVLVVLGLPFLVLGIVTHWIATWFMTGYQVVGQDLFQRFKDQL